ncbi:hypothetical protein D3C85_1001410 [compost metagenome]
MAYTAPLLDKPAPGWKHDLPSPNSPPIRKPNPSVLSNPPNYVDDIYLELPRSTLRMRGVGAWIAILFLLMSFISVAIWITAVVTIGGLPEFALNLFGFIAFTASLWGAVYMWRMDTEAPRNEPIRFNRLRRKVYVYRFHHDGGKPFSRSAWGIRPVAYDWDDLHAEACGVYGPMGTGGSIQTVTLAALKPGTHEVIDRFLFAHEIQQGEMYWAMAQLFMQQGPHALPTFPYPPRDWNNEDVSFNLARRLAPKVQWPAEMDLESRTAP